MRVHARICAMLSVALSLLRLRINLGSRITGSRLQVAFIFSWKRAWTQVRIVCTRQCQSDVRCAQLACQTKLRWYDREARLGIYGSLVPHVALTIAREIGGGVRGPMNIFYRIVSNARQSYEISLMLSLARPLAFSILDLKEGELSTLQTRK
jgi:hypothetical protein